MKKVITVRFEGEGPENCYDLKQWDRGVTLRIEGLYLPEKVEVHFALDNSEMAQVRLGTTEDEVTTVKIPAFILENADQIACVSGGKYKAFAYIYQSDEESGWTVRKIIFHIEARQRPEDYVHTEEDLKTWEKLENRIGEVDKEKLTAPQNAQVGQIFKVQEVNEDGTITLEAEELDKSLKLEGYAADAKAVGDAVKGFVAIYGETTYDEIKSAIDEGKTVRACKNNIQYKYISLEPGTYDEDFNQLMTWDELIADWVSRGGCGDVSDDNIIPPNSMWNGTTIPAIIVIPDTVIKLGGYVFSPSGCQDGQADTVTYVFKGTPESVSTNACINFSWIKFYVPWSEGEIENIKGNVTYNCNFFADNEVGQFCRLNKNDLLVDSITFAYSNNGKFIEWTCHSNGDYWSETTLIDNTEINKKFSQMDQKINDETDKYTAIYGDTTFIEITQAISNDSLIELRKTQVTTKILEPGTYDFSGNMIQTWDEMIATWVENGGCGDITSNSIEPPTCVFCNREVPPMVVIPDDITSIGQFAFHNVGFATGGYGGNMTITFLSIPTSIGNFALGDASVINMPWSENEVAGAPWGNVDAELNYNYTFEEQSTTISRLIYQDKYKYIFASQSDVTEMYVCDKLSVWSTVKMPSGAVDDVQINGTSIVGEDGVAVVPFAKTATYGNNKWTYYPGIVGINHDGTGIGAIGLDSHNALILKASSKTHISDRHNLVSGAITSNNFDYAVKCAMTDGKGEAWTAEEQAAARNRMGVDNWEIIADIVLEDEVGVSTISVSTDSSGNSFSLKKAKVFIDFKVAEDKTGAIFRISQEGGGWNPLYLIGQTYNVGKVYGYFSDISIDKKTDGYISTSYSVKNRLLENGETYDFSYNNGAIDYGQCDCVVNIHSKDSMITDFLFKTDAKITKARVLILGVRK